MTTNIPSARTALGELPLATKDSADEHAAQTFDAAFASGGPVRAAVMSAFEQLLEALPRKGQREEKVRDIAKAAALSAGRSHANIIDTGRTLLGNIDELGQRYDLDVRGCKDQVMLGLAEGACQIGPIVYGRFLDIASEYRDNADDWIIKNKRRAVIFDATSLPVIVPFVDELTLSSRSFKDPETLVAPTIDPSPAPVKAEIPQNASAESLEPVAAETPVEWSRPKGKGFFRRLSDVMGNFFSRS